MNTGGFLYSNGRYILFFLQTNDKYLIDREIVPRDSSILRSNKLIIRSLCLELIYRKTFFFSLFLVDVGMLF